MFTLLSNKCTLFIASTLTLFAAVMSVAGTAYAGEMDSGNDISWLLPRTRERAPRPVQEPVVYGGQRPADDLEQSLIDAAREGQVKQVKNILAQGARANAQNTAGQRALHGAVANGHWEVARLLLRGGADVNGTVANGNTPLTIAAQQGDVNMARLLLVNGADIEQRNRIGNTPLVTALLLARDDMAAYLLKTGASIAVKSGDKRCVAELAAAHSGEAIVQRIFDQGGAAACQ